MRGGEGGVVRPRRKGLPMAALARCREGRRKRQDVGKVGRGGQEAWIGRVEEERKERLKHFLCDQ